MMSRSYLVLTETNFYDKKMTSKKEVSLLFAIKNLSFRYPKNKEDTLKNISFTIEDGEIFGLLGPSGVGKSTTQKIMVRLLHDYQGEIKYQNRDLRSYSKQFYQDIGVGFEMPVHFSKLTCEENLNFFKQLYQKHTDINELLKRLGLTEDKNKKVAEFSKGMKVRLNFARALLNEPRILFLDEPTSGLDPKNARIIKAMIKEFQQKGGTVLLSSHLMNDVDELCDRVAFMAHGRIVEINTPKNLKLKYGERKVEVEFNDNGEIGSQNFELDSFGNDPQFLNIIQNKEVVTIHSKETTLDDIFIRITGVEINE